MDPEEIVTVDEDLVKVYGEAIISGLDDAEAAEFAATLRRHFARAIAEAQELPPGEETTA